MKNFWYALSLILLLGFSCKKKEFPESVSDTESDFYFTGAVDGTTVSLKSGKNNYFMYSSFSSDTGNVYAFGAELKPQNCNGCKPSIQVIVNDYKTSLPGQPAQIDSSLRIGLRELFGKGAYSVSFKSQYNQTAANYLWDFGDNTRSTEANPTHTYSSPGNYSVSLRITGTNSCQQYIKKIEKIKYHHKSCNIGVLQDTLNFIKCIAEVEASAPYKYSWDFGDGFKTDTSIAFHNYKIPGTYPVALRVIDADQDTLYAKYNHATQTNPMPCLTNYKIESLFPIQDHSPFGKVTINWTDEAGVVYTSSNYLQPNTSYFKILSVEEYELNEKNEKTKKIKVQFKCQVYNGTKVKSIDQAEAVLCVSYK